MDGRNAVHDRYGITGGWYTFGGINASAPIAGVHALGGTLKGVTVVRGAVGAGALGADGLPGRLGPAAGGGGRLGRLGAADGVVRAGA
ncbi:hypothetical protein ACWEBX_32915 [Streptomyces sp. NPDC005070]